MTSQIEQQASGLQGHLPECPVRPKGFTNKPPMTFLGWTRVRKPHPACICDRLRACEQRVRMEDDDYAYVAAQAEAEGRRHGWNRALDAARERIMRLPYEIDDEILIDRDEVLAWIDALREQPADQTGYNLPDAR